MFHLSQYHLCLGAVIFSNAYFGMGTGPILLDDLLCTGSEARLVDCPRWTSQGIGTYDYCYGHYDDAGVRCMLCKFITHCYIHPHNYTYEACLSSNVCSHVTVCSIKNNWLVILQIHPKVHIKFGCKLNCNWVCQA